MNYKLFACIMIAGSVVHGQAGISPTEDKESVSTQGVVDEKAIESVDNAEAQAEEKAVVKGDNQESKQVEEGQQVPDAKRMIHNVKIP